VLERCRANDVSQSSRQPIIRQNPHRHIDSVVLFICGVVPVPPPQSILTSL